MHALHFIVLKTLVGIIISFTSGRDERVRNEMYLYLSLFPYSAACVSPLESLVVIFMIVGLVPMLSGLIHTPVASSSIV